MPTYGQLKESILGFMNRAPEDFVINLEDNLLRAANQAKDYCQRAIHFELAKDFAQLQLDIVSGGDLVNAVLFNTTTPVAIKCLKRAFIGGPSMSTQIPIPLISRDYYTRRLERRLEQVSADPLSRDRDIEQVFASWPTSIVQHGRKVYLVPSDSAVVGSATPIVYFDIVKWIPDFVLTSDTNFLLDYCFDYLLFRSIYILNFFLKEDQRAAISLKTLEDIWNNVIQWNATVQSNYTEDATLD